MESAAVKALKKGDVIQVLQGDHIATLGIVTSAGTSLLKCWCRSPHPDAKQYHFEVERYCVRRIGRGAKGPPRAKQQEPDKIVHRPVAKPPPELPAEVLEKAREIAENIVPQDDSILVSQAPAACHPLPIKDYHEPERDTNTAPKKAKRKKRKSTRKKVQSPGQDSRSRRREVSVPVEGQNTGQNLPAPENS